MPQQGLPRLIGALAVAALAAPTASARPATEWTDNSSPTPPVPTVTRTIGDGLDWGSAAIGAGTATGLLLVVAAGVTSTAHRHMQGFSARCLVASRPD
jgi:hypothetical protein